MRIWLEDLQYSSSLWNVKPAGHGSNTSASVKRFWLITEIKVWSEPLLRCVDFTNEMQAEKPLTCSHKRLFVQLCMPKYRLTIISTTFLWGVDGSTWEGKGNLDTFNTEASFPICWHYLKSLEVAQPGGHEVLSTKPRHQLRHKDASASSTQWLEDKSYLFTSGQNPWASTGNHRSAPCAHWQGGKEEGNMQVAPWVRITT